jgi:hypothetical protein
METIHIMYTHKGKFHQAFKKWSFAHAEVVLERLGATYWEIGIHDTPSTENKK